MPGRFAFEFGFSRSPAGRPKSVEAPMRILLMGDFGGRAARQPPAEKRDPGKLNIHEVDIDNFDAVLAAVGPKTAVADLPELAFESLDDFHPDRLYTRLEAFHGLRQLRKSLLDPVSFRQAAAQLGAVSSASGTLHESQPGASLSDENHGLFERLLGKAPEYRQKGHVGDPGTICVDRLIEDIIAPHVVPRPDPQQQELIAAVDKATAELMGRVLHHPAFQALEGCWRGVYDLVSRLETDETLKVFLVDVTIEELAADIAAAGSDLSSSGIYRLLVDLGVGQADGEPWSALIGAYRFGPSVEEMRLVAALGALASHAGGPFIAAASESLAGCNTLAADISPTDWQPQDADFTAAWKALRESEQAPWIGLALPRVLQRLPYGVKTEPLDTFAFEELETPPAHEHFLWANPAFACARLLGENFRQNGWSLVPDGHLDIDDLPAYIYEEGGEPKLQACAEWYLTERQAEGLLSFGLMPLLSHRNRNSARLLRFQSIASPPQALSGPWQ